MAKNIITEEMVTNLNKALIERGCGFEYTFNGIPGCIQRNVIDKSGFVHSAIVNCTKTFYEWFENWFKEKYNIELIYNNTGEICWAKERVDNEN